jgi:phage shock protein A
MLKLVRRAWKYMTALFTNKFNEAADPNVQLEQAITEAQEQHQRLRQQAANVIANQKQTELRLNRALEELERANVNTRQALKLADDAGRGGDAKKAVEYTTAAESLASKMITLEAEVESLKTLHLQATEAADQAKSAVQQNSASLRQKLSERQKLLGQLDQAKMQEQMNKAMATLNESVGQDVPTFEEVRIKIEARYARAKGMAELNDAGVVGRVSEIEAASQNIEARARLDQIRAELGLASKPLEP